MNTKILAIVISVIIVLLLFITILYFNPFQQNLKTPEEKVIELPEEGEKYNKSKVYSSKSRAIVYILPSKACNKIWHEKYGDRIYFYVHANLSEYSSMIGEDFRIISKTYDTVIIIIPGEDTELFYYNLAIVDKIALENDLRILWAIFPKWKYGEEAEYLVSGTRMNKLVLDLMEYLANLDSTWKIAIWYGWENKADEKDIIFFYENLPVNLRGFYAVWLDEPYADIAKKLAAEQPNFLVVTELYSFKGFSKYSKVVKNQMVITGYSGAKSLNEWCKGMHKKLKLINRMDMVGIWIFYDIGDGHGEEYAAYFPHEGLADPWSCIKEE